MLIKVYEYSTKLIMYCFYCLLFFFTFYGYGQTVESGNTKENSN